MTRLTVEEIQAKLPDLIHNPVEGGVVVITENDRPVAKLVIEPAPAPPVRLRPPPGLAKGILVTVADDDDHLDDFKE